MGRTYTKLTLTALIWGGTFVAGGIVAVEAGPFSSAFMRFVVASAFLLAFMAKSNGKTCLLICKCMPFDLEIRLLEVAFNRLDDIIPE